MPGTSFVSTNGAGFLASTNVMSPRMSSWHMPDHVTGTHATDALSSSLNDSYLSSYFTRSATLSNDGQQVGYLVDFPKCQQHCFFSHVHYVCQVMCIPVCCTGAGTVISHRTHGIGINFLKNPVVTVETGVHFVVILR